MKKWFVAKKYGYGWTPTTWQGWAVALLYIIGILYFAFTFEIISASSVINFVVYIAMLTIFLIIIAYITGEKPRWQWGGKPLKKKRKK